MQRSLEKYQTARVTECPKPLWVRPTFRLENRTLVAEPAGDYDEFVKCQEIAIRTYVGERRSRKRIQSVVKSYASHALRVLMSRASVAHDHLDARRPISDSTLELNLTIIEELGKRISANRGCLVVVDASKYFNNSTGALSRNLELFCKNNGLGYVELSEFLDEAEKRGHRTRWKRDPHFNEIGNEVFAQAMFRWLQAGKGSIQ